VTRVYLARHGRTALNAAGTLRGRSEVPLDDVGVAEAERLGAVLGGKGARLVVSSPLRRAVETAQPLALHLGLRIRLDPRLADRDYGQWTGAAVGDVVSRFGSVDAAPGVEPREAVVTRALAALLDACHDAEHAGGPVVVVSHDVVNRLLLAAMSDDFSDADRTPQETGCYNTLGCDVADGAAPIWSVLEVNKLPGKEASPEAAT